MADDANRIYSVVGRFRKPQWKTFVRGKLGLTDIQIEECEENNSGDITEQRYQMVRTWQLYNGRVATIDRLEELADNPNGVTAQPRNTASLELNREQRQAPSYSSYSEQPPAAASSTSPVSTPVGDGSQPNWSECGKQMPMESELYKRRENSENHRSKAQRNNVGSGDSGHPENSSPRSGVQPLPEIIGGKAFSNDSPGQNKKDYGAKAVSESSATNIHSHPQIVVEDGKRSGSIGRKIKRMIGLEKKTPSGGNFNPPPPPGDNLCEIVTKVKVRLTTHEHLQEILGRDFYPMRTPKGCVLILNNSFKSDPTKARCGSQKDVTNMDRLWKELGCDIYKGKSHCDKSASEMSALLGEMTQLGQYSYIVIVIMTHGGTDGGHLYFKGADGKNIKVDAIEQMFNNQNAKKLQNIPKLFLFQFCRGRELDKGVETDSFDDDISSGMKSVCHGMEALTRSDVVEIDGASALPTVSDMLFAYATQPNYAALRHPENGSWFINAITNVFMNYACVEDVDEMLTRVNNSMKGMSGTYVRKNEDGSVAESHPIKAMSNMRKNLCKKLYLVPGLSSLQ